MMYYQRNLLACKLKNLPHQQAQRLCFVPELAYLQAAIFKKNLPINVRLKRQVKMLAAYQKRYGRGVIPMSLTNTQKFVEKLYAQLLNHRIPLPRNIAQEDLKYTIRHFEKVKHWLASDFIKIKIARKQLTFFAKYLPLFGRMVTFTLTVGLTISTVMMLVGWGWPITLLVLFGLSKFLASYADISGGPERRFRGIGFWLDRLISRTYRHSEKKSYPRIILHLAVSGILACSCLLTWYASWQIFCYVNSLAVVSEYFAYTFAGLYAWSSATSNFGRIYHDLYDLLLHFAPAYFCFDNVKKADKLDLQLMTLLLAKHPLLTETKIVQSKNLKQELFVQPASKNKPQEISPQQDRVERASRLKPR